MWWPNPCTAANPPDRVLGFTLLEIMVAMVILTLIITSSFGVLRLGERSWEASTAITGSTETLRTAAQVLRRILGQSLPLSWTSDTETYIAFNGTPYELRFIAPAPHHLTDASLFEYRLAAQTQGDTVSLILYYRLYDPGSGGFTRDISGASKTLLADGLRSAEFSYYGSPAADDPPAWHTQWDSGNDRLPRLVRAQFVPGDGLERWPALLLALYAETPP